MDINYELYKVFYEVAKEGNITKACQSLNVTQPAISKSIKNLEEYLGGNLFIRGKKGVILTKEGQVLFNYIKQAKILIENGETEFSNMLNLESGTVRIGISTNLTESFFIPYLSIYHQKHPKVKIKIITDTGKELIQNLKNGLVDIIIMHFTDKKYSYDLNILKIKDIDNCLVVGEEYKNLTNIHNICDLQKYPFIMQIKGSSSREIIESYLEKHNINISPTIELSSYTLVSEFAKLGLGIGLTTKENIQDDIKNGKLYEIKLDDKLPNRYIGIATLNNKVNNYCVNELLNIINNKKGR